MQHRILHPVATGIAFLSLLIALIFLPTRRGRVVRDTTREILLLQGTECEYKGIKTTFDEMTKAYALTIYNKASFVRWDAQPNPDNPDTEALVSGIFTTWGVATSPRKESIDQKVIEIRRKAVPSLVVTWRVKKLAGVDIVPHNGYAHDAIAVYRRTVNNLIDRMVFTIHTTAMREGPGDDYAVIKPLEIGTVLLQEGEEGAWVCVRVPSTVIQGWVGKGDTQAISR